MPKAMWCERCQDRPATVTITRIENGRETSLNLCEVCAQKRGQAAPVDMRYLRPAPVVAPEKIERPADRPSEIAIPDPVVVRDLAEAMKIQPFKLIAELISHKVFTSADRTIDFATASLVCARFGVKTRRVGGG